MVKKKNLEYLLKNVPSPKSKNQGMITFLFAALLFFVFAYVVSVSYTGLAISEFNEPATTIMKNQNIVLDDQFEVLEIKKTPYSVLNVWVESDVPINVFAEIEDCPYWKNGKDLNNNVLYAVNNIQTGNFKIGNPPEKTMQQVQIYESDYVCFLIINRNFPQTGNVNIKYSEEDVNQWRIIK